MLGANKRIRSKPNAADTGGYNFYVCLIKKYINDNDCLTKLKHYTYLYTSQSYHLQNESL